MRSNDIVSSYISGINKLSSRDNPFNDNDDNDITDDSISYIPAARFTRRYGFYAAAVIMFVFISVGIVFIRADIDTYPFFSSFLSDNERISSAISDYNDAQREKQGLNKELYERIIAGEDRAALKAEINEKRAPVNERLDKAAKQLASYSSDKRVLFLSVLYCEKNETTYLSVMNKTRQNITVGRIGKTDSGKTFGVLSPVILKPDEIAVIAINTHFIGKEKLCLSSYDEKDIIFEYDPSKAINTLPPDITDRLDEFLQN